MPEDSDREKVSNDVINVCTYHIWHNLVYGLEPKILPGKYSSCTVTIAIIRESFELSSLASILVSLYI